MQNAYLLNRGGNEDAGVPLCPLGACSGRGLALFLALSQIYTEQLGTKMNILNKLKVTKALCIFRPGVDERGVARQTLGLL